tara:strand:+ start:1386 stop:2468 length:1083 start_codon:yes stop_codon:yes gene_type:complete
MANTIDWGKATQNNTNGYGKYQNTIGAASVYAVSAAGETVIEGTSAAFSYAKSSYHQGESDPTPTITGTTGGTFSATSGLIFVDSGTNSGSSTGQIDLSASTIQANTITYTVDGVSANFSLSVTAAPFSNQYSFDFDGVDEVIDLGTSSTLELTDNFTISFWIKETSSLNRGILVCGDYGFSQGWRIYRTSAHKIAFHCTARTATSTTSINTGDWFHVLATFESNTGSNRRNRIYINGSLEHTSTGLPGSPTYTGTIYKQIAYRYSSTGHEFAGNLDEIAVWDSLLSSSAITEVYNSGTPNNLNSLSNVGDPVAWYRMGEEATFSNPGGTGNWTLTDQGTGSNDGTSVNMEEADRTTDTP